MITKCTSLTNSYKPAFKAGLCSEYAEDEPRWLNIKKLYEEKTKDMPECQLDILDDFESGAVFSLDNNELETTKDSELSLKGYKNLMNFSDEEIANKLTKFTKALYDYDNKVKSLLDSFKNLMQNAGVDKNRDYNKMYSIFTEYAGPKQLQEAKYEIYKDEFFRKYLKVDA